ncbi:MULTISPECIES: hypothetical protein [unclassified Mesorhizobium]|uniref:hypothetical protein n=1 Tax=unclassified Mesorhizobium TaxID=325217 RepID=UPI0003D035C5|nr:MULTISPECIES: hypothetical protein [unclassified Mesorhizobium]ESZ38768.1 hypothetical protein X732_17940 [Mesorhizobium sp. L2C066B000]WJI77956.1 hypothetical protein NLY37_15170 [Mesorhizobium sp. C395A]
MDDGMGEHLGVFDLDALRKAFLEFVEEHKTTDHPEWGELAKLFLEKERERHQEPDPAQPEG